MRPVHHNLGVIFTVGPLCAALAACTGSDPGWDCHRVNVPGGETVECVGTSQQTLDTTYNCVQNYDVFMPCPPDTGTTTDGTGDYGKTTISTGGEAYGTTDTSGGGGSGTGGSCGAECLVPECYFAPDLNYCGPGSYGGGTAFGEPTSGGGSGGGTDVKGNGNGNGNGNGGGGGGNTTTTDGGTPGTGGGCGEFGCADGGTTGGADGGTSGGADGGTPAGGGGSDFSCEQHGNTVVCKKPPVCAQGLKPSPCGACIPANQPAVDCVPPAEGGCWFTGGGYISDADGKDSFGGNGKPMKNGTIQGEWNHVDHGTMDHAHGKVEYLVCRVAAGPGPSQPGGKKGLTANQVYFGGHARWRANDVWNDGYWFDVVAEDHGEPGNEKVAGSGNTQKGSMADWYHFTIRMMADPATNSSGTVVYETSNFFEGGNFQIHPNNPGHPATASTMPSWVAIEH